MSTTPASVFGWHIFNQDVTDTYLQIYDLAQGSVTVGTTTPTLTIWVPASGSIDTWQTPSERELGMFRCAAAVTIAATTTVGGSTNPTNGLLINLSYA